MKQSDLEKRRQSLQSAAADTEDDFEEIVVYSMEQIRLQTKNRYIE